MAAIGIVALLVGCSPPSTSGNLVTYHGTSFFNPNGSFSQAVFNSCSNSGQPVSITVNVPDSYWDVSGNAPMFVHVTDLAGRDLPTNNLDGSPTGGLMGSGYTTVGTAPLVAGTCFKVTLSVGPTDSGAFDFTVTY